MAPKVGILRTEVMSDRLRKSFVLLKQGVLSMDEDQLGGYEPLC